MMTLEQAQYQYDNQEPPHDDEALESLNANDINTLWAQQKEYYELQEDMRCN